MEHPTGRYFGYIWQHICGTYVLCRIYVHRGQSFEPYPDNTTDQLKYKTFYELCVL